VTIEMQARIPTPDGTRPACSAVAAVEADTSAAPSRTPPRQRISSHTLFGTAVEVQIDHNGVLYRLRRTAAGKLILTK
jgi:hemin uptake protein HemP